MKRLIPLLLAFALLLSGCGWMSGSYSSVEPYRQSGDREDQGITSVSNYQELRTALIAMVENAEDSRTLSLAEFNSDQVATNLELAIRSVLSGTPLAAYAVEDIEYDLGNTGGVTAVVITVIYNHNRSLIKSIRQVSGMEEAKELINGAVSQLELDLVMQVSAYRQTDYVQLIQNFALENPDVVMEVPQVTVNTYPETGTVRILEMKFNYQSNRDSLRAMQSYVRPKFSSAVMFVSGEEDPAVKYARLYAFLMETSDYTVETSITPAYSLLRHGVGDSKAFATVYAAMCRRAGLECLTVNGTREGAPWTWNIICENGQYYHLDLLGSYMGDGYRKCYDEDMRGYVWDFAAYPACDRPKPPPTDPTNPPEDHPTRPEETTPEETQPQETTPPTTPETTPPTEPPTTETVGIEN